MSDVKYGEILLPGDEETEARKEDVVRNGFWPKLRKVAGKIPFARDAVAAWYCATDRDTPTRVKGVLFAALAYFVMPVGRHSGHLRRHRFFRRYGSPDRGLRDDPRAHPRASLRSSRPRPLRYDRGAGKRLINQFTRL